MPFYTCKSIPAPRSPQGGWFGLVWGQTCALRVSYEKGGQLGLGWFFSMFHCRPWGFLQYHTSEFVSFFAQSYPRIPLGFFILYKANNRQVNTNECRFYQNTCYICIKLYTDIGTFRHLLGPCLAINYEILIHLIGCLLLEFCYHFLSIFLWYI